MAESVIKNTNDLEYSQSVDSSWATSMGTWKFERKGRIVQVEVALSFLETISSYNYYPLRLIPNWAKPNEGKSFKVNLPDGGNGMIVFDSSDGIAKWFGYNQMNASSYALYTTFMYFID